VAADAGKTIVASFSTAAITFNASVFAAGDMVSVVNTSAGSITLVQGTNVTLRLAGSATTGTRTLASNGLATVICTVGGGTPTFYCSGAGLT
jgi:spore maturation protein SpmA